LPSSQGWIANAKKSARRGGAVSDREAVAGQEFVLRELRLEHAVDHVEPAARLVHSAPVEPLFDRVKDDRLDGVGYVLVAQAVPLTSLQRRHEPCTGDMLDDDRGLADHFVAIAQHRDGRGRPQLRQLGAVEVALLLEDIVGHAQLVQCD